MMAAAMAGCGDEASKAPDIKTVTENTEEPLLTESDLAESDFYKSDWGNEDSIGMIYGDIYDEIAEENAPDSLEMMRRIISRLGEKGYAAVDSENQIDNWAIREIIFYVLIGMRSIWSAWITMGYMNIYI